MKKTFTFLIIVLAFFSASLSGLSQKRNNASLKNPSMVAGPQNPPPLVNIN
jgi:hypothetical protein